MKDDSASEITVAHKPRMVTQNYTTLLSNLELWNNNIEVKLNGAPGFAHIIPKGTDHTDPDI
ncbi:hypothetical protein E2C01_021231 [Portunus trituberculatus]|uniref:Uncharacterized protein n=1 Tax=Portunus trituberculatus TaxID=210409 RepID=A0A5B7E2Q2_PORTR|nr:hypothetical protein [Portunus trituberculatus]